MKPLNQDIFSLDELLSLQTDDLKWAGDCDLTETDEQKCLRLRYTYKDIHSVDFTILFNEGIVIIDFREQNPSSERTRKEDVRRYIYYAKKCKDIRNFLMNKRIKQQINLITFDEHTENYLLPKWMVYGRELAFGMN